MTSLAQIMQAHYKQLLLDFDLFFSADQVSHSGERGRLLEGVLSDFFSRTLPRRIAVGSGQIVSAWKPNISKQMDLVFYNAQDYALLINEKNFQIIPTEAVLSVIEVKSTLDKKSLSEGVKNVASAKVLRKFPRDKHPKTLGVLFCYKTLWKHPRTLFSNLRHIHEFADGLGPDLICCLDPGFLLVSCETLGQSVTNLSALLAGLEKESKFPADKYLFIRPLEFNREDILLHFYLILIDYLNRTLNIGVTMSQYTKTSTAWETVEFDFKTNEKRITLTGRN